MGTAKIPVQIPPNAAINVIVAGAVQARLSAHFAEGSENEWFSIFAILVACLVAFHVLA